MNPSWLVGLALAFATVEGPRGSELLEQLFLRSKAVQKTIASLLVERGQPEDRAVLQRVRDVVTKSLVLSSPQGEADRATIERALRKLG